MGIGGGVGAWLWACPVGALESRTVQGELSANKQVDERRVETLRLNQQAIQLYRAGRFREAIGLFQQARDPCRAAKDSVGEGVTLNNIGTVYQDLGQYPQALEQFHQALAILKEVGDRAGVAQTLNNIGFVLEAQQQPIAAIALFKKSVDVYEAIRKDNRALSPEQQKSYTEKVAGTYRELANLLINQGRFAEAERVLDLLVIQELSNYNQGTRATVSELGTISFTDSEKAILDKHNGIIDFAQKLAACNSNCSPDLQQ